MDNEKKLKEINKEIKAFLNESKFISTKCRNKIIKLLAEEFDINLPLANYEVIDITLSEEGNIIMRGDTYKNKNKLDFKEVEEHYNNFKIKAESVINKKNVNSYSKNNFNNIGNLIIILISFIIFIFLLINAIKKVLYGDVIGFVWLIIFISSWFLPAIKFKERLEQAKNFIKRKFKK